MTVIPLRMLRWSYAHFNLKRKAHDVPTWTRLRAVCSFDELVCGWDESAVSVSFSLKTAAEQEGPTGRVLHGVKEQLPDLL